MKEGTGRKANARTRVQVLHFSRFLITHELQSSEPSGLFRSSLKKLGIDRDRSMMIDHHNSESHSCNEMCILRVYVLEEGRKLACSLRIPCVAHSVIFVDMQVPAKNQ